jgi:hypothetical protein
VVQDVVLDGITSAKPYHTAVLAFGSRINAKISRGRFSSNAAGPAVVTLQHASLTVEGTAMVDCTGNSGIGVMTLDNSTVSIKNSTFTDMVSESGAAVLVSNTSRVAVLDSSFSNSTVKSEGAGIYAQHNSSLLVRGSSFSGNLAEQGAGVCLLDNVKVGELAELQVCLSAAGTADLEVMSYNLHWCQLHGMYKAFCIMCMVAILACRACACTISLQGPRKLHIVDLAAPFVGLLSLPDRPSLSTARLTPTGRAGAVPSHSSLRPDCTSTTAPSQGTKPTFQAGQLMRMTSVHSTSLPALSAATLLLIREGHLRCSVTSQR